jgi:uncharacterized phiE125 gp8 family phage protein
MWKAIVTSVAPESEPVSVADAKLHLQVEHSADDTYIGQCIASARAYVESMTATRLVTQTVVLRTDTWADFQRLPVGPIVSISSIAYTDVDGASQTLSTNVYEARLYGLEPEIVLKHNQTWPTIRDGSLIIVTAVAGYATIDPAILHALKILIADFYGQRESFGNAPKAEIAASVEALLSNHRIYLI